MSKKKKISRPVPVEYSSLRPRGPMEPNADSQPSINTAPTDKITSLDADAYVPPAPREEPSQATPKPEPVEPAQSASPPRDDLKTQEIDNRAFRNYTPPGRRQTEREVTRPVEEGEQSALRPGPRPPEKPRSGSDTLRMRTVAPGPDRPRPFGRPARLRPRAGRVAEHPKMPTATKFGFFSFIFGFIGLIVRMAVVTLLVMAIVGLISYEAIRHYIKTDPVIVPDVRGIPVSVAFDRLSEKKLSMVKEKSESSGLVAPGEITNQDPVAGTKTKVGSTVRVTVSSGRSNYVVPNVVNESRENAEESRVTGSKSETSHSLKMTAFRAIRSSPRIPKQARDWINPPGWISSSAAARKEVH
jgi:PASTA domain